MVKKCVIALSLAHTCTNVSTMKNLFEPYTKVLDLLQSECHLYFISIEKFHEFLSVLADTPFSSFDFCFEDVLLTKDVCLCPLVSLKLVSGLCKHSDVYFSKGHNMMALVLHIRKSEFQALFGILSVWRSVVFKE